MTKASLFHTFCATILVTRFAVEEQLPPPCSFIQLFFKEVKAAISKILPKKKYGLLLYVQSESTA